MWTYGLAFLGAHLAFMPLLVLLLPRRVEALVPDGAATVLSWLLLTGGVVAGIAHIVAGAIGDRWFERFGNRRGLIAIGTALVALAYVAFAMARTAEGLFAAMVFFQLALNCCFAPLGALLADHIADEQKGRMGGLMNAALPSATLLVVPVAWAFPTDDARAFVVVGVVAAACIVPLLVRWPFAALDRTEPVAPASHAAATASIVRDFAKAWLSRLLIQTGAAFVIGYIYLYIAATWTHGAGWDASSASDILAMLTAPTALLAILATLASGYLSDLKALRRLPLLGAALMIALGLALLAAAPEPIVFIIAYGLFQIGLAAFLSIDTALVAQLVAGRTRRGLLLGVMNLSNTLPAIIAPAIALLAFGAEEMAGALAMIFAVFAVGALIAGVLVMLIRTVR